MKQLILYSLQKIGLKKFSQKLNDTFSNFFISKFLLKISLFFWGRSYNKYWSNIKSDINLTDLKRPFKDLKDNGYAKIENYFTQSQLQSLTNELKKIKGLHNGKFKGDDFYMNLPDDGICAYGITPLLENCYSLFTKDKSFLNLAKALYGQQMKLTGSSFLCKYGKDKIDTSNTPHWDDWRIRLKIFLFLEDVNMENAPMIYFKGTHKTKNKVTWRLQKDFTSVFLPYEASAGGAWWPVRSLDPKKIYFTGKKGTCYIFDATGIHAGTQLTSGKRVMLMNMYTNHLDFTLRAF